MAYVDPVTRRIITTPNSTSQVTTQNVPTYTTISVPHTYTQMVNGQPVTKTYYTTQTVQTGSTTITTNTRNSSNSELTPLTSSVGSSSANSNYDLSITKSELENNISILGSAITELKNSWSSEVSKALTIIESSWAGPDCDAYVKKVKEMDKTMNNSIESLELLKSTFIKARDLIEQNQTRVMGTINS